MIPDWARKALGQKTSDDLEWLAEREAARKEVENTRFYRLITEHLDREVKWTEKELRTVNIFHFQRLQAYATALEIVTGFIKATEVHGNMAAQLLSERAKKNERKSVDEHMNEVFGVHQ